MTLPATIVTLALLILAIVGFAYLGIIENDLVDFESLSMLEKIGGIFIFGVLPIRLCLMVIGKYKLINRISGLISISTFVLSQIGLLNFTR